MGGVRWLLLKDLQILRRPPLQAVLLVAYPILIAVLVGFAISRGPEDPRVAFVNEVPPNTRINVGGAELSAVMRAIGVHSLSLGDWGALSRPLPFCQPAALAMGRAA